MADTPFESIESAHEYLRLLREQVEEVRLTIGQDLRHLEAAGADRRLDALRLVDYKLVQLAAHLTSSSRILSDLRALRRILTR